MDTPLPLLHARSGSSGNRVARRSHRSLAGSLVCWSVPYLYIPVCMLQHVCTCMYSVHRHLYSMYMCTCSCVYTHTCTFRCTIHITCTVHNIMLVSPYLYILVCMLQHVCTYSVHRHMYMCFCTCSCVCIHVH